MELLSEAAGQEDVEWREAVAAVAGTVLDGSLKDRDRRRKSPVEAAGWRRVPGVPRPCPCPCPPCPCPFCPLPPPFGVSLSGAVVGMGPSSANVGFLALRLPIDVEDASRGAEFDVVVFVVCSAAVGRGDHLFLLLLLLLLIFLACCSFKSPDNTDDDDNDISDDNDSFLDRC